MNSTLIANLKVWSRHIVPFYKKAASKLCTIFLAMVVAVCLQNAAYAAVAFGAAGNATTGTTSLSVPYPTGIAAGDLLILVVGNKYPTNGPTTPSGWTLAGQGSGGLGTAGADSGQVYNTIFVKQALGTESGNLTVTLTAANTSMARMFRYIKAAAASWNYAATTGSDNTAGTTWSVTGAANPGIISGDILIVGSSLNGNRVTQWTESVTATGATFANAAERNDSTSGTGDDMGLIVSEHPVTAGNATAAPVYTMTGANGNPNATSPTGASVMLRLREVYTTTLATGTDPAAVTIAPGAAATDVDLFTLQTSAGTETITAVTVNLSTNSGVGRLAITNNAATELGFTTAPVSGANTIAVAGMTATTTLTTFKVRVTPLSHAAMPLPPGAAYAITAPVIAWAGPNAHAGSDTNPNALTIDNLSPSGATAAGGSAGDAQVALNWTTSVSTDFSRSVVLRWAGSSSGTEVPAEGVDYVNGNVIGAATVVCVRTADAAATGVSGVDGAGMGGCSAAVLTNGQAYSYKIFQKDANGNYDAGVTLGTFTAFAAPMTCITDNFAGGVLDTGLWSVAKIAGTFTPAVVNAGGGDYRLRLTDLGNNEATFATLKRAFPGAGNKVVVEIDYFAYGGGGADGIAVVFSDSAITSTTGGFGGSLGYAQRTGISGFGGGWLGIGMDEYGNYPNPTEGRLGYPASWVAPTPANVAAGFYANNLSIRGSGSAQTGYNLLANTGVLTPSISPASGAAGATPYRYRYTIDHSNGVNAWVTVERDTTAPLGDVYTAVVPRFDVKAANSGQAAVPPSWALSFTGSTGGSTNYHEFKQIKVCANTIVGGGPHHFEIQHGSGSGVTCTPSTLTIKACADNLNPCTPYTGGVSSGTLSASGTPTVNWSGGAGFTIAAGSSTVNKDVQVTTVGSVVLGATSSPSAAAATTCNFGSPNCTFTSTDSALLVSAPNHAAESVATLTVQAVKSAPGNPLVCIPGMTGTKSVNLKCAYANPASGSLPVRVAGTALNATANATTACDAAGKNVSLSFDATGVATPTLQYADVGSMQINANYTGTAGAIDAGLSMVGSGSFIAAPASFGFSAITAGAIKAGNNFSATVTAKNSAGATTPNFGKEVIPEEVTLTSTLVTPNPLTYPTASNPTPGNNVIAGGEFGAGGMVSDANGVATVNNLNWGEVGSITLRATLTNVNGYLGTVAVPTKDALNNLLIASGISATVGAFIPDHFDTAVIASATSPLPCPTGLACPTLYNGFVYSGQPFTLQVTARNLANGTTTNYHSTFGLSNNVNLTAWDALGSVIAQNPGSGVLANASLPSTAFSSGVGLSAVQAYAFAASLSNPADIYLRAVDAVNTTVSSRRATPATSVEGGVKVVSGRIKFANANGSELLPLSLTAAVQYYDGSAWITSTKDSLTALLNTNIALSAGTNGLSGCPSTCPSSITPASIAFNSGNASFILGRPGVTGSVNLGLSVPANCATNPAQAACYLGSVVARATFGVYKGNNEFIYLRESY